MKNIVHNILQDDVNDMDNANSYSRKHDNSYFDSYSHPGIHYDMLAVSRSLKNTHSFYISSYLHIRIDVCLILVRIK